MKGHLTGEDHPDYCSCIKDGTLWGFGGWHLTERRSRFAPVTLQVAVERCPAYLAGIRRRIGETARKGNPLLEV